MLEKNQHTHTTLFPVPMISLLALHGRSSSRLLLAPSPVYFVFVYVCFVCFGQTVVVCGSCSTILCQPTGGKARLTEGCSFRKKVD